MGNWRLKLFSTQQQPHGQRRSALLRWAMISSGTSKVSGLALQAVAIPLVYHSLGQHRYALYLLLTAALAAINLAQLGAGPGLTQGLARANAAQSRHEEASLLNAAFRLTGIGALIGGGAILLVIHLVSPGHLFGVDFSDDRQEILSSANVCVFILMAQMVAGVVDSALSGYQEQVFSSIGSMVGNLVSVGLLTIVCRHSPTIISVVLVLFGVPTLSRLSNLAALYARRRYLFQGLVRSTRGFYATLLNVGLAFWTIQLCSLLEQNGGTFVLARMSSAHDTDMFAIVYRYINLASMAVTIVTAPLWPAIADAIAHGDIEWIRRSYVRVMRALSIYSGVMAAISLSAGPWIFRRILHVDTSGYYWVFFILGIYFVANIWTHLLYVTIMGMPGVWRAAAVLLVENILMLLFGVVLVPHLGAAGMALSYLAASLVLPVWLLPRLMRQELERISAKHLVAGAG
jgi:O-antigen/teichoic acid export membrane protein